ncbi:MAG: NYN domain-containing protein [Ignavibacteria bacterium]
MRTVIIDGNNVLHKMPNMKRLFKENPESAQLSLYESVKGKMSRNDKLVLVFDGFSNIKSANIIFSGVKTADDIIRKYIEDNYGKKSMAVVSSDNEIVRIAQACGCEILKSEDFVIDRKILKSENINHVMPKDDEKPEGMSRKDFDFFKNQFS